MYLYKMYNSYHTIFHKYFGFFSVHKSMHKNIFSIICNNLLILVKNITITYMSLMFFIFLKIILQV